MTIKEVEELLHITRANVRFYEKMGLLNPERNPVNGYREYSEQNIETLKKIIFFRKLDISIQEIEGIQKNTLSMEELLIKHNTYIKGKIEEYEEIQKICSEIINREDYDYEQLDIATYSSPPIENSTFTLKDRLLYLNILFNKFWYLRMWHRR